MNFLKFLRTVKSNKTQKEIAESVGVTERQYRRIENNEALPSYETILALENHFGKPIKDLLAEAPEETAGKTVWTAE